MHKRDTALIVHEHMQIMHSEAFSFLGIHKRETPYKKGGIEQFRVYSSPLVR